ncbi:YbjN domain-containing protein [Pseudomonas sichuanensis]|uniref:YbjN domain-containing protein n=1 Tax=Pseudomonas TaxID=286 RepID=UPI0036E17FEF
MPADLMTITDSEARKLYVDVLNSKGFRYEMDGDGDIIFQIPDINLKFLILLDSKQLEFVRVCCPNFYRFSAAEEGRVYKACNFANLTTKVGKVYLNSEKKTVWSAYESYVSDLSVARLDEELKNALISIHLGVKNFISSIESSE